MPVEGSGSPIEPIDLKARVEEAERERGDVILEAVVRFIGTSENNRAGDI